MGDKARDGKDADPGKSFSVPPSSEAVFVEDFARVAYSQFRIDVRWPEVLDPYPEPFLRRRYSKKPAINDTRISMPSRTPMMAPAQPGNPPPFLCGTMLGVGVEVGVEEFAGGYG